MILIASGAYVEGEFISEVGQLPPCFLPIGNKRLYKLQLEFLRKLYPDDDYFISVPSSFNLPIEDSNFLEKEEVSILRVPDGLTLGESLLYCWNASGKGYNNLKVLHGDTLFIDPDFNTSNLISVHPNHGFYSRASYKGNEISTCLAQEQDLVLSGFFSFDDPWFLMKSLIEERSNFIDALNVYIKTYSVEINHTGSWLDFGHINSFFHSRTWMTTQRAFNELQISTRTVTKSSSENPTKIYAEGNWFKSIPGNIKIHTPQLLNFETEKNVCYSLEYLYFLPLSDLLVFGNLPTGFWHGVLKSAVNVLADFSTFSTSEINLDTQNDLYLKKTLNRLDKFQSSNVFDVNRKININNNIKLSLVDIANATAKLISETKQKDIGILHGDFCFSNLLYDSRQQAIKCIDPRGIDADGNYSIYGDRRYDAAKLYHSVIGLYDLIIAGHYSLQFNNEKDEIDIRFFINDDLRSSLEDTIHHLFRENQKCDFKTQEVLAITIHLFLSMLPLHYDRPDRQLAFIANAIRLYKMLLSKDIS